MTGSDGREMYRVVWPRGPGRCRRPTSPRDCPRSRASDPTAEVNRLYLLRGWTDGLPIVPPTLGRIDEMLGQSPLERHGALGEMEPLGGVATVEKVAANAVMAGCRPDYFPVVLAAVLADPRSRLQPARRADHGRKRRAAPDRQRPGGAAARDQRGLGRARPGLAGQRDDRPRGAPGHEQPGRWVAGGGVLRRPRPAGALQPLSRRARGRHALAAAPRRAAATGRNRAR